MGELLLSVIVPIYNAEKYLNNCIRSIVTQSYSNLEIILVNDGSTDDSAELCNEFARQDKRIKVIHQTNGGQNAARKTGLDMATGQYVTFVDSDDWLDADIYKNVISAMQGKDYDMVSCDYFMDKEASCQKIETSFEDGLYERVEIVSKIFPTMRWDFEKGRAGISAHLWNKLFKADHLRKTICNLDYGMTICEDSAIVYPCIMRAQSILITHLCGYHYYQREDSVMHSFTVASFEKIERFQKYMQEELLRLEKEYSDITEPVRKQIEEQFNQVIIKVINNIVRDVYHINYNMPKWCPPYKNIPAGSKIALYGAGDVGRAYYIKLYGDPNYSVVLWVDKKHEKRDNVESPERLLDAEYDIILIAVESESLAIQIKKSLIELGVNEQKLVWQKPSPMRLNFI